MDFCCNNARRRGVRRIRRAAPMGLNEDATFFLLDIIARVGIMAPGKFP